MKSLLMVNGSAFETAGAMLAAENYYYVYWQGGMWVQIGKGDLVYFVVECARTCSEKERLIKCSQCYFPLNKISVLHRRSSVGNDGFRPISAGSKST